LIEIAVVQVLRIDFKLNPTNKQMIINHLII